MNAERLLEFLDAIHALEAKIPLRTSLSEFDNSLQQLASQPQGNGQQEAVAKSKRALTDAFAKYEAALSPAQWTFLDEMSSVDYFSSHGLQSIDKEINENPMTPAVAQKFVQEFSAARTAILKTFNQLRENLRAIGVEPTTLQPGEAELGFQIPRHIFDDKLIRFSDELKVIHRVFGFVSEAVVGSPEPLEMRQISASDPIVFVQATWPVILAVGGLITWLLDCQERTLRIRKLKDEAIKEDHPQEGLAIFDKQITNKFDAAKKDKIAELLEAYDQGKVAGRKPELEMGLKWAIDSLEARMERGMIVELRFIPPPAAEEDDSDVVDEDDPLENGFIELEKTQAALTFPEFVGEPITELPAPEPPKPPRKGSKSRS